MKRMMMAAALVLVVLPAWSFEANTAPDANVADPQAMHRLQGKALNKAPRQASQREKLSNTGHKTDSDATEELDRPNPLQQRRLDNGKSFTKAPRKATSMERVSSSGHKHDSDRTVDLERPNPLKHEISRQGATHGPAITGPGRPGIE